VPEAQPAGTQPDDTEPTAPEVSATTFVDALGGGRGLFDSAVPATVFVLARLVTGSLTTAVVVAVVSGLLIIALRRLRGEPLQQAAAAAEQAEESGGGGLPMPERGPEITETR
jgi:hypothetical protein